MSSPLLLFFFSRPLPPPSLLPLLYSIQRLYTIDRIDRDSRRVPLDAIRRASPKLRGIADDR